MNNFKLCEWCFIFFIVGIVIAMSLSIQEQSRQISELKLHQIQQDVLLENLKDNWIEIDTMQNSVKSNDDVKL